MDDPENNAIERFGIANLFELLSKLYLQTSNCEFATLCLLQSIIETPSRITDKQVYDGCNHALHSSFIQDSVIQEASFTLLYFGLAHEIGHSYGNDCFRHGTNIHSKEIADEAIVEAVANTARTVFEEFSPMSEYYFGKWHEGYVVASQDKRSIMHCDNLRSEILADYLGFNILSTSISSLARQGRQQLNFKIVISETIIGLFVVQLLEACKYLVAALPDEQTKCDLVSRYFPISVGDPSLHAGLNAHEVILDFQIAHMVRWEFLKPSLVSLAIMHLFPDTYSVRQGEVVSACSAAELTRRREIAENNVDGYFGFYRKETGKLLARLEDIVNFASHMATSEVPMRNGALPRSKTFREYIFANFGTYLDRLSGSAGAERKRDILAQLTEYSVWLQRHGKDTAKRIESIVCRLKSDLCSN